MGMKPGLDCDFVNSGRDLVIKCDLKLGWRRAFKRWRFGATRDVDLPHDRQLRVTVTLCEVTYGAHRAYSIAETRSESPICGVDLESQPPSFTDGQMQIWPRGIYDPPENEPSEIVLCLQGSYCEFLIQLLSSNGELSAALFGASARLHHSTLLDEAPIALDDGMMVSRPFSIDLRLAIRPPRRRNPPDIRDFDCRGASAGRPSGGKRRP